MNNSILWGNTANLFTQIFNNQNPGTSFPNVTFNLIENGPSGNGNISSNPLFLSDIAEGYDGIFGTDDDGLQLQLNSPAIDVGTNSPVTTTEDLLGNPRSRGRAKLEMCLQFAGNHEVQDQPNHRISISNVRC